MAGSDSPVGHRANWRDKLYEIIFGHVTFAGHLFDLVLLIFIFLGVLTVLLDSVRKLHATYGSYLRFAEWGVTALFTLEYAARLLCTRVRGAMPPASLA
jgi:voltage-gated potassium channel